MTRNAVLAIDASTTAVKVLCFDPAGTVLSAGRAGLTLEHPAPDGYEQDAESWWTGLVAATRQCLSGIDPARIAGLCVTHQRETVVVTNTAGIPLYPALVWMDARCKAQVEAAKRELGQERLHRVSGKPACTTPSLYKLKYLLDELAPDLKTGPIAVCDVHGFLVWRLTGTQQTSLASADPLGLVDLEQRAWCTDFADWLGCAHLELGRLHEPGVKLGGLSADAARALGLPVGLPVIAGAGDGQAAGLGAGITRPDEAYLNLGTAIVSGVLASNPAIDPAFRTLFAARPGAYFLETDLKGGTFTLNWLTDLLLPAGSGNEQTTLLSELEHEAARLPPGADGLVAVPYWCAVMNPFWDDDATGVLLGLHGGHGRAHLYRAILEGIALEQRLHTEGVERASRRRVERFVVMGGGAQSDLWCQILADVLGRPIVRAKTTEATALGAAILAAVGLGLHADAVGATQAMTGRSQAFEPGSHRAHYDALFEDVYRPLYPALRDAMHAATRLRSVAPTA